MGYPFIQAKNYAAGRGGEKPVQVTLHYMVTPETDGRARWCARWFGGLEGKAPQASSTYTVDNREIYQCVREADTSWTNANRQSNQRSITIEAAGSTQKRAQWLDAYSTAERKLMVKLTADICKRNGIPARWINSSQIRSGEKGICGHGDVTVAYNVKGGHTDMGFNEGFPWALFMEELKAALGQAPDPSTPTPPTPPSPGTYTVRVTTNGLNVRSGPGTNYPVKLTITDRSVYTIVETQGDWGRLKSGAGWIHLGYTSRGATAPARKTSSQLAAEVKKGLWGNGEERKRKLTAAGYNYQAVQDVVNGK